MEQAGVQLIAQGASAFDADMKSATNATNTFVDATDKGSGKVSAAGQVMIGSLRQIGTIAVDALAMAAKATAAFVGDSINLAGDFEQGMLNFQAVAGKDVDTAGLEQFRDLFLQIGKELPVSTSDVQNAAIEMIKGGIEPAIVAAGGLKQNIQFAAAAMEGDLVSAAEISAKILGGWTDASASAADKAAFLTRSTDLMTKAANASAVDVKGLSQGIFNAQGIAKTAGVSFDDLTTTLAALAPRFASSSEAGNSLKNMIARLQPTTTPATGAMEALGLYTTETGSAFYDAQGNFVGFEKAAQLLQDSLAGLTKEQQAQMLQTIFGNDAMGSAAALADMGAAGYSNMADMMAKANGVAENAALKQQGFNTALDNAKGSVEALQITIGSALLPILTDLMNNVIAPAVNTLTDMADALFGNEEAFNRLSPPLQTVVDYITMVVANVDLLIDVFNEAGGTSSEFGESIVGFANMLGLPGEELQDLIFFIQDLVVAFSEGGQGADVLGSAIDDLNGIWTLASKVISDALAGYEAIAKAVLPQVTAFVDAHGAEIEAFFTTTWDSIVDIVTLALKLYDSIVPPTLQAIAGFITDHGEEIQKVLSGAWQLITSIITGTLDTIKGLFQLALDVINGDWDAAWTDITGIATAQTTAISGAISGFLDMIAGLFNTSMADIKATWQGNLDMLVDIANKIGGDMVAAGGNIVGGIVQGISDNAGAIYDKLSDIADNAVDAFLSAIGAKSPATEFMPAGKYAIQGVMEGMQDVLPALLNLVDQTGTSMIAALTKNISKGGDLIRKQMEDLTNDIKDIGDQINDAIGDAFGATASIDRQVAKNFSRLGDVGSDIMADYIQQILASEQKVAESFADPAEGAKYFKMVSDNIFETAALKKKMDEATDEDERARLKAQWAAISRAQEAEMEQFKVGQRGKTSAQDDIAAQIAALFQSNDVARNLPGVLQNTIVAQLTSLLDQLRNATPQASQGYASPPASQGTQPSTSSYSSSRTYNMPIYTNNSSDALRQSLAIAEASMA